jgi:hypothetical protein
MKATKSILKSRPRRDRSVLSLSAYIARDTLTSEVSDSMFSRYDVFRKSGEKRLDSDRDQG